MSSIGKGEGEILNPSDFDAIREAVMETPRGRWFLSEFANRVKSSETIGMLDSMRRLESALASNHAALMSRLAQAIASEPASATRPASIQPDLAPKHMKFFKQDEEIFEPAPQARIAAVPDLPKPEPVKTEAPKGAKVIIRRASETSLTIEAPLEAQSGVKPQESEAPVAEMPPPVAAAPEPEPAPVPAQGEAPQKRRIVIIRHKPGEDIDVPLQNEMAEAS
jgi:hypothetical protein